MCNIWDLIVNHLDVDINIHCFCIAVLTFSKYGKYSKEFTYFMALISKQNIMRQIPINSVGFRQILTAFGNLEMVDEMWSFYEQTVIDNCDKHDIQALNIIAHIEYRVDKLKYILDIVDEEFDLKSLELYSLVGLYRVATTCNNMEIKTKISKLLNTGDDINVDKNIVACFDLNGKQWIMHNGMDNECQFNSVDKVDQLIQDSGYIFDNSVANEIPNNEARQLHLKYHAEKKALSVLLFEKASKMEDIRVSVSIAMCNDCHKFFAEMSKYCDRKIECNDPNGLHIFQHGRCSLCHH